MDKTIRYIVVYKDKSWKETFIYEIALQLWFSPSACMILARDLYNYSTDKIAEKF